MPVVAATDVVGDAWSCLILVFGGIYVDVFVFLSNI